MLAGIHVVLVHQIRLQVYDLVIVVLKVDQKVEIERQESEVIVGLITREPHLEELLFLGVFDQHRVLVPSLDTAAVVHETQLDLELTRVE